jgi:hypothetical protein
MLSKALSSIKAGWYFSSTASGRPASSSWAWQEMAANHGGAQVQHEENRLQGEVLACYYTGGNAVTWRELPTILKSCITLYLSLNLPCFVPIFKI